MKKPKPAPTDTATAIADIGGLHRRRRYAMKVQQKIDRAMESFVRINATGWTFDADEREREKFNREVAAIIKAARHGKGMPVIVDLVQNTDKGREPFDAIRDSTEKEMERLAATLPAAAWIASVRGAGNLGLATIIGEAGDLAKYPGPEHLWSRLGYAPYGGFAGSTWKRDSWRPRALTKEEWIAHPFSGQRYALTHQLGIWLVNAQWIGAAKAGAEDGEGKPNGYYGHVYYDRRQHTFNTHADWTKQHRRMDALRVTMKAFLKDLWCSWNGKPRQIPFVFDPAREPAEVVTEAPKPKRRRARGGDEARL